MSLSKISRVLKCMETPEIGEKPNQPKKLQVPIMQIWKKGSC